MISIILPVYNESSAVLQTLGEIEHFFQGRDESYELVIVDDGSVDDTSRLLRGYHAGRREVTLHRNRRNHGKGFSLRAGMALASGDSLILIDSDLSYPPEQIPSFVEALARGYDLVIGSRRLPSSRFVLGVRSFPYIYLRHLQGLVFNAYVRRLMKTSVRDTQCGIKAMTRAFAAEVVRRSRVDGFSFDVELLAIARRAHARVLELPVTFNYVDENDTKIGPGHIARAVFDVLRIRAMHGGDGDDDGVE